jgi:hypothetical protein
VADLGQADLGQSAAWHRQIAALTTAADRAGVATAELPALRSRLFAQQARFAEYAARAGAPLPALAPTPAEIAAAAATLGDMSPAVVGQAMRSAHATLDAADTVFAAPKATVRHHGVPHRAAPHQAVPPHAGADPARTQESAKILLGSPQTLRNGVIYSGYALLVFAFQGASFFLLDEEGSLVVAAPFCLFVLPAFAWLAGWVTIGQLTATRPNSGAHRSPRLGAVICAIPDLLLCVGLAILFAIDLAQR